MFLFSTTLLLRFVFKYFVDHITNSSSLERTIMIKHLLVVGITFPVILGAPQNGFNGYTTYEPGNLNIIITSPHGGSLDPSTQSNGDKWPDRTDGCKYSNGICVWTHNCGTTSSDCKAKIFNDHFTYAIAQGIANKINRLTGEMNGKYTITKLSCRNTKIKIDVFLVFSIVSS